MLPARPRPQVLRLCQGMTPPPSPRLVPCLTCLTCLGCNPFTPVLLLPIRTSQKTKAGDTPKSRPKAGGGAGGGAKGAKGKKGAAGGKGGGEATVKKTRRPSTVMWRISDELAAVVGSNEATVDTIRSGVHGYIKAHNLQV